MGGEGRFKGGDEEGRCDMIRLSMMTLSHRCSASKQLAAVKPDDALLTGTCTPVRRFPLTVSLCLSLQSCRRADPILPGRTLYMGTERQSRQGARQRRRVRCGEVCTTCRRADSQDRGTQVKTAICV
jgi:hypothetical protein